MRRVGGVFGIHPALLGPQCSARRSPGGFRRLHPPYAGHVGLAKGFVLLAAPIDEKADEAEREIGDADHQVDALVVAGGQVVAIFLRTGGGDGFLSGRARERRRRPRKGQY